MTEKRQTSHGYIIRILQHFAMKLWNITNFVMLFQAVMKFLSRSKFSLLCKWSIDLLNTTLDFASKYDNITTNTEREIILHVKKSCLSSNLFDVTMGSFLTMPNHANWSDLFYYTLYYDEAWYKFGLCYVKMMAWASSKQHHAN